MKVGQNKKYFFLIFLAFGIGCLFFSNGKKDSIKKTEKRLNLVEISAEIKKTKNPTIADKPLSVEATQDKYLSYEDLVQKLHSNDFCKLAVSRYRTEDKVRALLEASDVIHADARRDSTIFHLFNGGALTPQNSSSNPVNEFDWILEYYNGMLLAGYVGDATNTLSPSRNVEKAEQIFRDLEEAHPENAVYSLVRASLLNKLGADREDVRAKLIKAMESPVWDTHTQFITQRLFRKSFGNLSYFYLAINVNAQMPIPVLTEPIKFLRDSLNTENYEEFIKKAEAFAYTIKPQNIPPQGRWEFYEWSALDYAYAHSILRRVWKVTNPQDEEMITPKPLREIMTYYNSEAVLAEQSGLGDFANKKICNERAMEKFYLKEKREYLNYLKR